MASPIKSNASPSVLHDILAWSIGRPVWWSDALRRIITKETLDDADRIELENLCRHTPGATGADGKPLVVIPLGKTHLPGGPNAKASVCIEYLDNLAGVNRLLAGQKIEFGSSGLTIIFGENGTGKSGYVRVIKKACRSRGAPPVIQPDAFAAAPPKASCKIGIKTSKGSSEVGWTDGISADEQLGNIFVFDTAAASNYLSEDRAASFTPFGLDVLPKLTKICDAVAQKIKQDIAALEREIASGKITLEKHPATSVGIALSKVDANTSAINLMALGELANTETKRLSELRTLLGADPKKKARETRAAKTRIETFKATIEANASLLSAVKMNELKECFENVAATEQAAKNSADNNFSGALAGTGSVLWRAMWEAAKLFSIKSAYPEKSFPQTEGDSRCVLCQRPFDAAAGAVSLAQSFEKFCNDDVQKAAKMGRENLAEKKKSFVGKTALKPEYEKVATDLAGVSEVELKLLTEFIETADDCLATAKKSIEADKWTVPAELAATPSGILNNLIDALEKRAKTEESADDPAARQKLQNECNELVAKEWLKTVKAEVESQIARYKQVEFLNERLADTKTNSITTQNSNLTKKLITNTYCQRFADEISALGLRTVNVKLEESNGAKGERRFGIRLVGAIGNVAVQEIFSEGEQRCVALAAFLAELSQSSHQSALVFDDPVSSLDQHYRSKVAERLVKEAKSRQVVVFTHDAVFLNDLVVGAEEAGMTPHTSHLCWDANQPGKVESGLPWDHKSPDERLDRLEKAQKILGKIWQPHPNDALKSQMRTQYGELRATIEKIVEKALFVGVVSRFGSYINLKGLDEAANIPQTECDEIHRLFKLCSNVILGHDPVTLKPASMPDATELANDIAATKTLLATIRARRKAARATP